MTSVRLPQDMEAELSRLCRITRRPKSFYLKEALGQYLARKHLPSAKAARGKKSPREMQGTIYDPLAHLVGKYSFGKGVVTNAAMEHNDIYDL